MKNRKNIPMSCERARNVCIVKTLAKLGHFPTRKSEKEAWFLSPLRSETQASFNVSLAKNLWYDFGIGKGGSIIDLIMAMKSYSVKEAVVFLQADAMIPCFDVPKQKPNSKKEIEIIKVANLEHLALKSYLRYRNIPLEIARKYCKEVWYKLKGREWFAIGLENNLRGWELRNKYCKNSSSPKSYSFIDHSSGRLLVTEGIFDFLSLAVLESDLINNSDSIILNSLAFIKDTKNIISKYSEVLLFLDNDPAGRKATIELLNLFPNVTDHSDSYKAYKDLNERLIHEKRNQT
jgi:5S rRNA maturation endonuclease (ribonuclease M5)